MCQPVGTELLPLTRHLAGRASVTVTDLDGEVHVTDDDADPEWVRWWACDPRPSGVRVRYGPSVRTMDELLESVAAEQAIAITGEFVAETYQNRRVVFIPVDDVEPCPLSLCTRAGDRSPIVNELRRAVHATTRDLTVRDTPSSVRSSVAVGEVPGLAAGAS